MLLISSSLYGQINDGGSIPKSFSSTEITPRNIQEIELPEPVLTKIILEDEERDALGNKAPRFGILLPVDIGFDQGKWTALRNGDRIWNLKIKVKNAKALNLYFDAFNLPTGSKFHVYRADRRQVIGGFSSHNNNNLESFAIELIYGDEMILEFYEPKSVKGHAKFHINEVGYAYRMVDNPFLVKTRDFGDSGNCEVNVNCEPEGVGKERQRDAVVRILYKLSNGFNWCSGFMINNTNFDCKPYFLTALHCAEDNGVITSAANFNQWIFYFNYQATGCSNPSSDSGISSQTLIGASVRAESGDPNLTSGSDFLLLELNNNVPLNYNAYYAGWDRSPNPAIGGYGIHHPMGDTKKVSIFNDTLESYGLGVPGITHWLVRWVATANGHGVTEGGSSGSPIFNSFGRIVGSLSGGDTNCSNLNGYDVYGKMSYHWDANGTTPSRRLKDWLDPGNTGLLMIDGAYYPCTNFNYDASIKEIIYPKNETFLCENPISPEITLSNFGLLPLTSVDIHVNLNGGLVQTYSWTGNLAPAGSQLITLPSFLLPNDNLATLDIYTSNPNGVSDENPVNDGKSVITIYYTSQNIPFALDFEGSLPPGTFDLNTNADALFWQQNMIVGGYGNSVGSMVIDNFNNDGRGTNDYLYISPVDLSGNADYYLKFDVAYARYDNTFYDGLNVFVSKTCGTSYEMMYAKSGSDLATASDKTNLFVPVSNEWRTETVDLSFYTGSDHVVVVFANIAGYGQPIYIDNVRVEATNAGPYHNIVSGQRFQSLAAAVAVAVFGDTILLTENVEENSPVDIPEGINFIIKSPYVLTFKNP